MVGEYFTNENSLDEIETVKSDIVVGIWLNKENYPESKMPTRKHENDAGFDLYSVEDGYIRPHESLLVHTGVHLNLKSGWEAQIRPRSGLALKNSVTVLNSPGTIDSDYLGEIMVILNNTSKKDIFYFNKGDRIAQMVIKRVPVRELVEISEKPTNDSRNESGFGSTGV